jgi:spore cortex formation protein SpoVR/YcgB (stage V sporulation)
MDAVERVLDAAHALKEHGVNRYGPSLEAEPRGGAAGGPRTVACTPKRPTTICGARCRSCRRRTRRAKRRAGWKTKPRQQLGLPEENLLYFIEKRAPRLEDWQRELIRIVRNVSQYFYPQKQLQMMNEGCATFCHYEIMNRLHDKGLITEGAMLEFLHSHSSVVFQPGFDDPRFSGLNPYALGFAMMSDIKRICEDPKDEDREYFPEIAGCGDPTACCATPGPTTATRASSCSI